MFRFTIRDVLWLTVVAALAVGWWVDRRWLEADYADKLSDMVRQLGGTVPQRWSNEEIDATASKASKVQPPRREISN